MYVPAHISPEGCHHICWDPYRCEPWNDSAERAGALAKLHIQWGQEQPEKK